jgi:hypothetical protein
VALQLRLLLPERLGVPPALVQLGLQALGLGAHLVVLPAHLGDDVGELFGLVGEEPLLEGAVVVGEVDDLGDIVVPEWGEAYLMPL